MRKLTTPDLFAGIRLLKKYGLKEAAKELAAKSDDLSHIWDNGYDFVWALFDRITEEGGEKELYVFLSGPFELTPEQVQSLTIAELFERVKRLGEENDLASFFRSAASAMR